MGVDMLNRGGFPQIQGPECDPGVAQSWSPAILAEEPPQPIPSHLVRILVRDETFRPARMRLARDWEMSSLFYESVLIPSLPMWDQWITVCAWCVVRVAGEHNACAVTACPGTVPCGIIRGEAFVNRFASSSASASAPMGPNLRIQQLQPSVLTATHSSPVEKKPTTHIRAYQSKQVSNK